MLRHGDGAQKQLFDFGSAASLFHGLVQFRGRLVRSQSPGSPARSVKPLPSHRVQQERITAASLESRFLLEVGNASIQLDPFDRSPRG
jgi:hypothetical protein